MKRVMITVAIAAALFPFGILAQPGNNSVANEDAGSLGQTSTAGGAAAGQYPRLAAERRPRDGTSPFFFGSNQGYTYRVNSFPGYPESAEKPLIIRSAEMNPKDEVNLEEDLAVMAHLLDKALDDLPSGQAHTRSAMGIDVFMSPNSAASRTMYLEGYGALFLVHVGFPVLAPAATAQEEKPSGDSAWEEARRELYGQPLEPQALTPPAEEFSEDKVNRLKEALLKALKNASNIRGLDGGITLCVLGGANVPATRQSAYNLSGGRGGGAEVILSDNQPVPMQGTVLTIKVTKADVDTFAKGELKFADFRERARVTAYTTAAGSSPLTVWSLRSGAAAK